MYPNQWHTRVPRLLSGALLLAAAPLAVAGTGVASAAGPPGNNGTVKVHNAETPADDPRNEPKGCEFYFVGSKFDPGQDVSWKIQEWPPTAEGKDGPVVLDGELTLDENGHGRTDDLTLPDGHYKLFWNFDGNGDGKKGADDKGKKHKTFWVKCDDEGDGGDEGEEEPEPTPPPEEDEEGGEKPPAEDDGEQDGTAPPEEPEENPESGEESPEPKPAGDSDDSDGSDDSEAEDSASGGLPVTGAALGGLVAAALATLGGGGAVMYAARRKKSGQGTEAVPTEES